MKLLEWHEIPTQLQNDEVKLYYQILRKKRWSLVIKRLFDFKTETIAETTRPN